MEVTSWLKWVMEPSYEPTANIDCGHRKLERSLCWQDAAAPNQLKTFSADNVSDRLCWNVPFGSSKLAGPQCASHSVHQMSLSGAEIPELTCSTDKNDRT
ncbi:hypothetical protein BH11PSE5_BH11PSE5_29500 [soil metagenome]